MLGDGEYGIWQQYWQHWGGNSGENSNDGGDWSGHQQHGKDWGNNQQPPRGEEEFIQAESYDYNHGAGAVNADYNQYQQVSFKPFT